MADPLEVELAALGRLSTELDRLGASLSAASDRPGMSATPDAGTDMPSLAAARPVSAETIPGVQGTVGARFTEVGDLVDQARTRFKNTDDDRGAVITSAGSLLPPAR